MTTKHRTFLFYQRFGCKQLGFSTTQNATNRPKWRNHVWDTERYSYINPWPPQEISEQLLAGRDDLFEIFRRPQSPRSKRRSHKHPFKCSHIWVWMLFPGFGRHLFLQRQAWMKTHQLGRDKNRKPALAVARQRSPRWAWHFLLGREKRPERRVEQPQESPKWQVSEGKGLFIQACLMCFWQQVMKAFCPILQRKAKMLWSFYKNNPKHNYTTIARAEIRESPKAKQLQRMFPSDHLRPKKLWETAQAPSLSLIGTTRCFPQRLGSSASRQSSLWNDRAGDDRRWPMRGRLLISRLEPQGGLLTSISFFLKNNICEPPTSKQQPKQQYLIYLHQVLASPWKIHFLTT